MKRNVGHLMTTEVATVQPSAPFKRIVRLMTEHRVSALPVVDEGRHLIGLVSEGDLVQKETDPRPDHEPLFESQHHRRLRTKAAGATASDVMTRDVMAVGPAASVAEAAQLMTEHRVKRLPVVSGDGRLLGVVSRIDLLRVFLREDGDIRQEVVEKAVLPSLNEGTHDVRVDVENGEVFLRGQVARRSLSEAIAGCARQIEGVVSVHDGIEWGEDDIAGVYAWVGSVLALRH